ncbi:DUF3826 domain-containing protein [Arcicella sp. LKC2W]|uniref:DUF3826 domain-containing protein n=1 Tax=Arcicella sp. LKC2W TaxID=2984198 RepID=UPI002B21B74E|nr:DUF3826 domain-containing protein [Arcicella sp. LKC2W]MEA5460381.1 DUF3826 domain-containing protein [Arcicella sp. LKC2W]
MNEIKKILTFIIAFCCLQIHAQDKSKNESSYQKVVTERAAKIVKSLNISDTLKAIIVRDIIANQYKKLNDFHEVRKANLKTIVKDNPKSKADSLSKIYTSDSENQLNQIHKDYLKSLRHELSKEQIEGVKNGMTYSVFPNTFRAYQEMMPDLSKKQKKQLYNYLYEAREHAMDAESSDKKHAWFGKYKGRINNYLSKEGIDMKVVSLAWEKKIREREEAKKNATKSSVSN